MKTLLLADIHSNLEALNAVLADAEKKFEKIVCLGDIVGYGAQPNECIEAMKKLRAECILGNHDAATIGALSTDWFNPHAASCIEWTKQKISEENERFLEALPKSLEKDGVLFVHGSPREPLTEYMNEAVARQALKQSKRQLIVVGHTHVPFVFSEKNSRCVDGDASIDFSKQKMLVNLPAVGQPRDANNKAGYALLDVEKKKIEIKRIAYDFEETARKIIAAGLPSIEAERLRLGR